MVKIIVKLKHDNGSTKIAVWANSIKDAISTACKAERCNNKSVIYARVALLTIHDIKQNVEEGGSYFFSRETLKFFGQTVGAFKVKRHGADKFYIYAPYGKNCPAGKTERVYNPFTNELEFVNN